VLSGILRNGDPIDALITLVGDTTFAGSGSGVRFLSGSTPAGGDPSPPGTTTPPPDPVPEPTAFVVFGLMTVAGLARRRVGRAA
jgi:hypothetical protein